MAKKIQTNIKNFIREKTKSGIPFLISLSFLCTWIVARIVVSGLYSGWLKIGGFLFIGDTHVHHLNYGIVILSIVGFLSLILSRRFQHILAVFYGIGLALTFDEFAMWYQLKDEYYSALSYNAVLIITAFFIMVINYTAYHDFLIKRRASHTREVPPGTVLFKEGDTGDEAYLIIEGKVEIFRERENNRIVLAHLGPDEFVGEMALFSDKGRSASAQALVPLTLKPLTKQTLLYNINQHPELGVLLIQTLTQRLIVSNDRLSSKTTINS